MIRMKTWTLWWLLLLSLGLCISRWQALWTSPHCLRFLVRAGEAWIRYFSSAIRASAITKKTLFKNRVVCMIFLLRQPALEWKRMQILRSRLQLLLPCSKSCHTKANKTSPTATSNWRWQKNGFLPQALSRHKRVSKFWDRNCRSFCHPAKVATTNMTSSASSEKAPSNPQSQQNIGFLPQVLSR